MGFHQFLRSACFLFCFGNLSSYTRQLANLLIKQRQDYSHNGCGRKYGWGDANPTLSMLPRHRKMSAHVYLFIFRSTVLLPITCLTCSHGLPYLFFKERLVKENKLLMLHDSPKFGLLSGWFGHFWIAYYYLLNCGLIIKAGSIILLWVKFLSLCE